ncbi:hypothetical protein M569_05718, partial [Genlisea aurea]
SAENLIKIYSNFMLRVQMFEDLVSAGTRFLSSFQQALGYLSRPPIDAKSTFVDHILKENRSQRVISYIDAGCMKADDASRSFSKLNASHIGLQDHVKQGFGISRIAIHLRNRAFEKKKKLSVSKFAGKMILDELRALTNDAAETLLRTVPNEAAADYAFVMGVVYVMAKRDFEMQVRIVSSLSMKSSTGEMETYSRMWSLRPYVDDEMMQNAWSMI